MKTLLLGLAMLVCLPFRAFALDEIFKIETAGTEYCGDFNAQGFNGSNNVDLWVKVVSDTELTVSFTPNFAAGTTFPMFGHTYLTGPTSAAFVGGVLFQNNSFATIQGTAKFDRRTGAIASLKGTFVQSGVLDIGCFSSGNFTSQRVA
jgi:hypothetical protein